MFATQSLTPELPSPPIDPEPVDPLVRPYIGEEADPVPTGRNIVTAKAATIPETQTGPAAEDTMEANDVRG